MIKPKQIKADEEFAKKMEYYNKIFERLVIIQTHLKKKIDRIN